MVTDNNTSRN